MAEQRKPFEKSGLHSVCVCVCVRLFNATSRQLEDWHGEMIVDRERRHLHVPGIINAGKCKTASCSSLVFFAGKILAKPRGFHRDILSFG